MHDSRSESKHYNQFETKMAKIDLWHVFATHIRVERTSELTRIQKGGSRK